MSSQTHFTAKPCSYDSRLKFPNKSEPLENSGWSPGLQDCNPPEVRASDIDVGHVLGVMKVLHFPADIG